MKKILFIFFITSSICYTNETLAQQIGVCGTHDETLVERVEHNRKNYTSLVRFDDPVYIPITFHNIGKNDGSGKVRVSSILNQLGKLNDDYEEADANITFYLKDSINNIHNTTVYSYAGTTGIPYMKTQKNGPGAGAMNIFIAQNADHGGQSIGTILGFYSPGNDWVVIRKAEIIGTTNTLTHEGGHFLSLPHTFYGWETGEGLPYDPQIHGDTVTFVHCPGTTVQVELMDKSNCNIAADKFCDTPPDYNFGFGHGCSFGYDVWDRNFDKIETMTNNHMSYFSEDTNCPAFTFTPEQVAAVKADVASPERDYLSHDYIPNADVISDTVVLLSPYEKDSNGRLVPEHFDAALIEWEPVPNASQYILEVYQGSATQSFLLDGNTTTSQIVENLKENSFYSVNIKPFNEGYASNEMLTFTMKTNESSVGTKDIDQISSLLISPNPVNESSVTNITLNVTSMFEAIVSLYDINGRVLINHKAQRFTEGRNAIEINTQNLSKGLYFIRLSSNQGQMTRKLIIQ